MTHKTQVNIRIPNIESLYCINCKINLGGMQHPLVKSLFHSQILTCRLIIYTMRCCIASPSIQNADDMIHIIVEKSFYDSGKFHEYLSKININYTNPEPVHPKIYEACLKYTFTFRLAPHWNLVGKSFYLQGFNFLSLPSNINTLEWKILFKNSNDIKLELIPRKMNLFPLTIESLSLPSKTVDGFTLNLNINSIDLTSFESPWVYVLPNLTKARIVSVSKILPENCPFKNYNELRRHWKNMYSYRLPKNEQGLLFYEVVFPSQPNQYFTYPEICVLSRMPEMLMCDNKKEVALLFLKDLADNVHSVCGEVIQVCNLYPQLDIEYTCILRKKSQICENQGSQPHQSNFFNTPTELTIKPTNERLNLSSLFTYQGMDKMNQNMKNHSQQVISIMQNKKRQRKSIKEDENEYLTQSIFNSKKRKFGMKQNHLPNMPHINHEKTIVSNLEDIISFHDLPSMLSKNKDLEKSHEDKHVKQIEDTKSVDKSYQLNILKPVIKNVEKISFDMTDPFLPKDFNELKINKNKDMETDIDKTPLVKNISKAAKSIPKYFKSKEKNDLFEHQFRKDSYTPTPFNDIDTKYRKLQSSIHSIDLDNKLLSEILPKDIGDKTLDSTETQSYDQKIRSFLSSFDFYNIEGNDEVDIKKQLYEQYKKLPAKLNDNNEIPNENSLENLLKASLKKSDFSPNGRNNLKYDITYDRRPKNSLSDSSPSFLISKNDFGSDLRHTYSGKSLIENKKTHTESEINDLRQCDHIMERGYNLRHQSVSEKMLTDTKEVFQPKNRQQTFFESQQPSISTNNTFQETRSIKMLKKFDSTIEKKSQNTNTKSKETSYEDMNNSSFKLGNLKDSYTTPSLHSILKRRDNLETANELYDSPQYPNNQSQSPLELENALQHKRDINEFAEQADFLSILSESSNGSDTCDYESCKLVFKEALTLNK